MKKYNEILQLIKDIDNKKSIYLGLMGMSRTIQLVKYIANHKGFEDIIIFEDFIYGGLRKLLYDDVFVDTKFYRGIEICNSLIPILEDGYYDSSPDELDSQLMSLSYSLVEDWYYFINLICIDLYDTKIKKIGEYLLTSINLIDSYLSDKYDEQHDIRLLQSLIDSDSILIREIKFIDSDVEFINSANNMENNKLIRENTEKYMQYKFWEM